MMPSAGMASHFALIALGVTVAVSASPGLAKPAAAPSIRLTQAEGQSSSGCTLSLDRRAGVFPDRRPNLVVGHMHLYDDDMPWMIGINGTVHTFPRSRISGQAELMSNRNGTIRVEMRTVRRLQQGGTADAPWEVRQMAVTIIMRNARATVNVYQYCSDH